MNQYRLLLFVILFTGCSLVSAQESSAPAPAHRSASDADVSLTFDGQRDAARPLDAHRESIATLPARPRSAEPRSVDSRSTSDQPARFYPPQAFTLTFPPRPEERHIITGTNVLD